MKGSVLYAHEQNNEPIHLNMCSSVNCINVSHTKTVFHC